MVSETPENPIQITDCIKTKLCLENYKENYPSWEREIFDVLRGHGLLEFFFATNLPSMPADGTPTVEFERWKTKDKVIWNWVFSTLPPDTKSNLGQLAHETTNLLWQSLRVMYSTDPLPSEFNLEDPPFIAKTSTRPSSTPENPTIPQTSSTSVNPIEINHQISIPLNEENYQQNFPHWKSEVLQILGDLGLQDYLDLNIFHGVPDARQDKLIRSWLWSSLPPTIVFELRYQPCVTTEELWECLESMYSTYYFPKIRRWKLQLERIKKGNATCAEYLKQFNYIIDQLTNVGCFLEEQQRVDYVLQGLGPEFEPFVTAATMTSQTLTMTDLLERLFDEEKRLKHLFVGQNSNQFASSAQYEPLSQPPIVRHPGQYSSQIAGRAHAPLSQPPIVRHPGQYPSLIAGRAHAPQSQPPIVRHPGQNPSLFAGRAHAPQSQPPIVRHPGQNPSLFAGRAQCAPQSQPPVVRHPGQNPSLFAGRAQCAPQSQPPVVRHPGQNPSLFAGRAQCAPLYQPPIVRHPGQYSSRIAGQAHAPLSQPPIVRHPGQNSSLIADQAQYAPHPRPPIVRHPGQNSSLIAGRAQYTPLSQPPIVRHPGQYSSMLPGRAQHAPLSQPPIIRHPGQYSNLFAGLGAEDSDIPRSLPQDTPHLPLQTRDPAAGDQVVIISDDEEDAD